MSDPVIVDLNRYLLKQEEAEDEYEAAIEQLWRDRYQTAERILSADVSDDRLIRMLIAWVEQEVEECGNEDW
jgi:hypothetical protein